MDIVISTDPWQDMDVDAFVCPTNSLGVMTQYPTSKIRELCGKDLQPLIEPHTPLAVGAAFVTDAGRMKARWLIHVPDTDRPGGQVQVEDVLRATTAVLVACEAKKLQTIAIPLMGAFEHGIPAEEAARAIHSQLRSHRGELPTKVYLMANNDDEVDVFEMAIEIMA